MNAIDHLLWRLLELKNKCKENFTCDRTAIKEHRLELSVSAMTHSRSKRGAKFKAMMLLFDNPRVRI